MQVKRNSIVYLSYDGMTDPLGQSQVIPYLRGLAQNGYGIHLISFEKNERYSKGKDQIECILKAAGIQWHPLNYTSKPPVISTIVDVKRMEVLAAKLIRSEQITLVHCRSYISALVGLAMKRKYGVKFLFDMRGFWADERVDGNIWNLKNPLFKTIYSYFKRKEIQFLNNADAIVSLTHNAANEISSWKNFKGGAIDVIPCCADLALFQSNAVPILQKRNIKEQFGIPEQAFVLSYLGSLGTWYMLDEMLDFFKVLKEYKSNAVFLFITADKPEEIYNRASDKGISQSAIVVKSAARQEVPLFASISNLSVFFIRPSFSKKASSPTKMGELMAGGIPLIVNAGVGDVDEIMQDGGNGRVIQNFTTTEYHDVCRDLDSILAENPERTIQCAQKWYALEQGVARYTLIYKRLLG
jgi:glycosyltransferase involved in cell wall biosynthesis